MNSSPDAVAIAPRTLVRRFERSLDGLDRANRPPNRRERYYLREALRKLEMGLWTEAEDALLKAERLSSLPEGAAHDLMTNDGPAVPELRAELKRISQMQA